MTYTEHGDEVILQMSREDYDILLSLARAGLTPLLLLTDYPLFCLWLDLINRMIARLNVQRHSAPNLQASLRLLTFGLSGASIIDPFYDALSLDLCPFLFRPHRHSSALAAVL